MTPVRRMVVANVAIIIDKETRQFCSQGQRPCRFLDEQHEGCLLFAKTLKIGKETRNFIRCKLCLDAEPM